MAQQAREQRQALTVAPRYTKPAIFGGTDAAWRVLCDLYPSAETQEIIMAVVEYCAAKRLDPFKRPVHIVPMYNSKLRRRVQVVMQGINEVEITASRTGVWAGLDIPAWGPEIERTFRGTIENDDGSTTKVEKTLGFPLWCALTVYRLVGGEKRAFTEQLFWEECYASAGFRTEIPNERWSKAPHQMLHKCVKAAVLRAAFPEEGLGYTAEEMEDRETDTGGVTIDGKVDHGDPAITDRDRQGAGVYQQGREREPPPDDDDPLAALDATNGDTWLQTLRRLLDGARDLSTVVAIGGHKTVRKSLDDPQVPTLIRANIRDMLREAHERMAPDGEPQSGDVDPVRELIAEIETMDGDALDSLAVSAAWRVKTRGLIAPDYARLDEAITLRRAALRGGKAT